MKKNIAWKKSSKRTKKIFEMILFKSRYIILLAVFSLIISSVFIFIWTLTHFTLFALYNSHTTKEIIIKIITSIDLFLL